ncbi:MAG: transcription elongation factor GreB [Deltaproteobacteria bacterium]|nr:transcription elongation factor GreB [Deltaproteobacteria bacterium]
MREPDYITRRGMETLRAELTWLHMVERPRITAEVSYAASLGDRSENAEYIYGKKRLREIDRRMGYLAHRLSNIQVVETGTLSGDRVRFGATVVVEDEGGDVATWHIYGVDEVNVGQGIISLRSPLGAALLGHEEGETVRFKAPQGDRELEILEVRFEAQSTEPIVWPVPER